jgi:oxaloacetate decarboxylase (Na+ extruding) subunit gamma
MQLGLELALMGMGTVFIFLIMLIFLTILMSKLISAFEMKLVQSELISAAVSKDKHKMTDEILNAVIVKAIQQHRSNTLPIRKEV